MDLFNHETGEDGKIPLALCKQAALKIDAFASDIYEILEDPDLSDEDRNQFSTIAEVTGTILGTIVSIVQKEIGEDEFLSMDVPMDEIGSYPGDDTDIMDAEI